ncbi:MAG: MarR family transcriptional regulator [Solirubrobacteraceae bacterium]
MPDASVRSVSPTQRDAAAELRATLGLLYRRLRQTREVGDLSLPESTALSRLDRHGPITAAELARLEQVSPQSIGATVQSLEARQLIDRAPDPGDGRRMILSLTQAGRETVYSKRTARTEQLTGALAALTADEQGQLIAAIPALRHLAEAL